MGGTFLDNRSSNGRCDLPTITYFFHLSTPPQMATQYIYSGTPRPEDQFVNFLIEQKVLPSKDARSRHRPHVNTPFVTEVAVEEGGPWGSCGKGLCVEDIFKVCCAVVFCVVLYVEAAQRYPRKEWGSPDLEKIQSVWRTFAICVGG